MKKRMFLVRVLHSAVASLLVPQSAAQNEGRRNHGFETQNLTQAGATISPALSKIART